MNPIKASGRYGARDFFTYTIRVQNLAPLGTTPGQFTIDANCDFLWEKATFFPQDNTPTDYTADSAPVPNLTVVITDTSTGRNLMNVPVPAASLFGSGQLPFILPMPKLFKARATVQLLAANNSSAITWGNVYFNFIGTQLFLA